MAVLQDVYLKRAFVFLGQPLPGIPSILAFVSQRQLMEKAVWLTEDEKDRKGEFKSNWQCMGLTLKS